MPSGVSATSTAARGEHEARPPIAIDRATAEQEVLGTLRALLAELRGGPPPAPVALDDLLDRDLGLGSLERVELVLRLQKRFGVDIPDEALAEAQRGRDIVAALLRASAPGPERAVCPVAMPEAASTARASNSS